MNDEQKADALDLLLADPPRRARILDELGATAEERAELVELAEIADAAWLSTRHTPPIASDPIAAMLGVVPTPGVAIDPARFKRARLKSDVSVSQLRDTLTSRGWHVSNADIASWQTRTGIELLPALLQDLGHAMRASLDDFTEVRAGEAATLHAELRNSDWFVALVDQWQHLRHTPRSIAEAQLLSRAAATVHRGEKPNVEQIRELLEHVAASNPEAGGRSQ
ncbi:hypothetical protein [Parafrigoribacterium soli]|uniref:hypothetical protein n=1 Tax=Parafrigoribacterium soli TaxID=3144663 RepID=UPI0032EE675E